MRFSFLFHEPITDRAALELRMTRLAALGYHGIELSASHPPPVPLEDVAALAARHGLAVVSLLSGWSYAHEGLALSSPNPDVRGRAIDRLADYVRQAESLRALLVIGLMQGLRSDEPDEALANERIASGLREVAAVAERAGVTIVLEPVNHLQVGFNHTAAEARAMAQRVGSPALGYMLDTLHMNIEERSVVEAIREHGPHARHVHLCETNGRLFGTGGLDFAGVLAALDDLGYDRDVSIKVYRHADWEEAARSSAEFLNRLDAHPSARPRIVPRGGA